MAEEIDRANLWQHPNGMWYVRAVVRGHRRKYSTGLWTKLGDPDEKTRKPTQGTPSKRVLKRRDEIMDAWFTGTLGLTKATVPTVAEWWLTYQASILKQQSAGTQEVYEIAMGRFSDTFLTTELDKVRRSDCIGQINRMRREKIGTRNKRKIKLAVATIETTYVVIRGVFEAAIKDGLIEENPWKGIDVEKAKPRMRMTSPSEDAELLGALSPYHRRWYRILLWTGLRISELTGLVPARIHWTDELITVKGKGSKHHRGGKWRDVPIMPEVAALLREQIAERKLARHPQTPLWAEVTETFDGQLRRRCKDLGMPLVTPHTLRHTFATRYMEHEGNIYFLSKILGHSSVAVTEKLYLHESKQSLVTDLRRVWSKMAPPPQMAPAA